MVLPQAVNYLTVYSLIVISFIMVHDVVQAMRSRNKRIKLWNVIFLIPTFILLANSIWGVDMGMSKEEFMKRYKADMEKKAKEKESDYKNYITNLHLRRNKRGRL